MKITYLGHSAFRIETGASVILIDPFLTGNPHFEGQDIAAATAGVTLTPWVLATETSPVPPRGPPLA